MYSINESGRIQKELYTLFGFCGLPSAKFIEGFLFMQELGKYVIIYTDMLEKLTYRQAILFGVLNGMAVKESYCYARNKTLSKILNCSEDSIQRDLNVLQKLKYIHREIERNDKMEVVSRKIYTLTATLHLPLTAELRIPSPLNCDNNKNNNNNINNNRGDKRQHTKFVIPTIEEIQNEFPKLDAQRFHDFYTAKGWMIGKNKMKDWKATARNWLRTDKKETTTQGYKKLQLDD